METPHGVEAFGVLVAPSGERWRARILTYPNILWLAPSGQGAARFVGKTAREAEKKAIDFITAHCRQRGFRICTENGPGWAAGLPADRIDNSIQRIKGPQSHRKIAFTPIRYGRLRPELRAGTGNVSETGLFIVTDRPEATGTRLRMRLELAKLGMSLKGEVCWFRARPEEGRAPGMGIHLDQPSEAYTKYVRSIP